MQSFTPVAVSALSRLNHDSREFKQHLLSVLSFWAFLGMGVGGALTLSGQDLIRVLLGPRWEAAGQIFTFFGPGFGIMFVYGIHGWIHLSIGRPGRWLRWSIIEFVFTGSLFVLALRWGPPAIAISWSISLLVLTIPGLWYAASPIDLRARQLIGAIWKFLVASILASCASALLFAVFADSNPRPNLLQAAGRVAQTWFCFGLLYLGSIALLHRSCAPIYEIGNLLREMVPWGRSRTPSLAGALTTSE
jgi:PST family polysaccharide transporter